MKLSEFGEKFATDSGIVGLMDDLGNALLENPDMVMMGGGNPGRLPVMEDVFRRRLEAVLRDPQQSHRLLGRYQSPQGDREFRTSVAELLREHNEICFYLIGAGSSAQAIGLDIKKRSLILANFILFLRSSTCVPSRSTFFSGNDSKQATKLHVGG